MCTTDDDVLVAFQEATVLTLDEWMRRFAVVMQVGVLDPAGYYVMEKIRSSRIGRDWWQPWYYTCTLLEVAPPAGSVPERLQMRQDDAEERPADGGSGEHPGEGTTE